MDVFIYDNEGKETKYEKVLKIALDEYDDLMKINKNYNEEDYLSTEGIKKVILRFDDDKILKRYTSNFKLKRISINYNTDKITQCFCTGLSEGYILSPLSSKFNDIVNSILDYRSVYKFFTIISRDNKDLIFIPISSIKYVNSMTISE